jgi:hypothetical protein
LTYHSLTGKSSIVGILLRATNFRQELNKREIEGRSLAHKSQRISFGRKQKKKEEIFSILTSHITQILLKI